MIDFFQDVACLSRAHCQTCRNKVRGTGFRASVRPGMADGWACPHGVAWGYRKPPGAKPLMPAVGRVPRTRFASIRQQIITMDGATERGRFMQAMLAQLELLMRQGRGGSCGERKAYKARLQQKVIALYEQTEPPSGAGGE